MKPAIRIQDLSKLYRIGDRQKGEYSTLRESIMSAAAAPWKWVQKWARAKPSVAYVEMNGHSSANSIWALKDVSFEINSGEVVGIVGHNGAGKSTLLKVLSRITDPTAGRVEFRGRIGSLLEVGTGFHGELTGRENIYINGAILGMKRQEISHKFDEIVAFAEIDQFLDTPVKFYSSGMHVRLAFAVAAHLEPEILLVDEVLAVGDLAFQKKCLGKMGDIAHQGRTILFVSHDLGALQALCSRGLFLQKGRLVAEGSIGDVARAYLKILQTMASQDVRTRTDRRGRGDIRLTQLKIVSQAEAWSSLLLTGSPIEFIFEVSAVRTGLCCNFTIYNDRGNQIARCDSNIPSQEDTIDSNLETTFVCELEELLLLPGRYRIDVGLLRNGDLEDHLEGAAFFDVEAGPLRGRPVSICSGSCNVSFPHRWRRPV
jgi:lipopolysaccharide transport system ATP-binding protein